jgi:hypothetical protein
MVIKFLLKESERFWILKGGLYFPRYGPSHSNETSHSQETIACASSGLASGGVKIL